MTRERLGGEKRVLSAFLDQQHDVLLWKVDGLTDDQLRQPMTPSGVCLLALVKHVAAAECYWLCEIFGRPTEPWRLAASDDVELDPGDTTDSVLAFFAQARVACDQAISELGLDTICPTKLISGLAHDRLGKDGPRAGARGGPPRLNR